jgi:hypothetical protein
LADERAILLKSNPNAKASNVAFGFGHELDWIPVSVN